MNTEYISFLKQKQITTKDSGFDVNRSTLNKHLFEWQADVVAWALRKGKCALFEDCGLGKTLQQLEFSRQVCLRTGKNALILAPLAVASQTVTEGRKFGIDVNICRSKDDVRPGINIANYEIAEKFRPGAFAAIVLDESSILKHHTSKTRTLLTDMFRETPYKLCCTATPAPNDHMELGNHAEFLGIMSQTEMLSTFFVHDGGDTQKWRLKGHAASKFYEWVASWACCMTSPADLGYPAAGYELPPLNIIEHIVKTDNLIDADGQIMLCAATSQTLNERRAARRSSLYDRAEVAAKIANATEGQTLIWCDLNDESTAAVNMIDGAKEIRGSDKNDHKVDTSISFSNGELKCLVSKPSISGWGMNWQNCGDMVFLGLSDSFEAYYQAIRRCWRYGRKEPVNVHIVVSDAEGAVKANIERKQRDAQRMTKELVAYTKDILSSDIRSTTRISETYITTENMEVPAWLELSSSA